MKFRGLAYRAHNPKWSWSPTSGEGARRNGGRFNRPGIAALYLSLDPATAIREASQGFGNRFPPLTLISYDIDFADIADLSTPASSRKHKASATVLACPWKLLAHRGAPVPTWDLADRLIASNHAGLIVRSFATGTTASDLNLVLWTWSDTLPHKVETFDPDGRLAPPPTK